MNDCRVCQKVMIKTLLIFIFLLFPAHHYSQDDRAAKKRIDVIVEAIAGRNENPLQSFVVKKRKYTEQWTYSISGGKFEFFDITYWTHKTKYSETYYLQNNQLIRAAESEDYYSGKDENSEWLTAWSGNYYFENRKLVFLSTNGHGKSETDDWEPEKETLDTFDSRFKELKRRMKKAAEKAVK